ncbi:MAG UNVERIFIED_CONTAM: hypothetical protein LVR18_15565 [Planctomycetaceae bacterium]|jgi:hypothetical protein
MKFHPRERSHSLRGCLITALAFGIVTAISGSGRSAANAEEPLQFNRDVRPILSALCFQCHGFDQKTREAGLRLDTREGALAEHDGRAAIRPKEPEASELLRRITSNDPEVVMPPPETKKSITPVQQEILRRWIAEGASYQQHWAFEAPQQSPPLG